LRLENSEKNEDLPLNQPERKVEDNRSEGCRETRADRPTASSRRIPEKSATTIRRSLDVDADLAVHYNFYSFIKDENVIQ
jgi:hypothetical protein